MTPIPLHPNLPTPTTAFGNPAPIAQYYICPHCKKQSPLVREWVGLTDEEIEQGCKESWVTEQAFQSAVWWAEAKLKEKNT
jgi:hypothetical protein